MMDRTKTWATRINGRGHHLSRRFRERLQTSARIFRIVVYTLSTLGFTYQTFFVCSEYFKYPTETSVTVEKALPVTNFPQIAICAEWQLQKGYEHVIEIFKDHTNPPKDTFPWGSPIIKSASINRNSRSTYSTDDPLNSIHGYQLFDLQFFVQRQSSCFAIKTRKSLNLSPEELFRSPVTKTISITFHINRPFTGFVHAWNRKSLHTMPYHFYMTSYDSDFDEPALVPVTGKYHKLKPRFTATFSYSQKVTHLYPPPYDTGCRDYKKDDMLSQSSCIRTCINKWTVNYHDLIFDDHVVDRDKYFKMHPNLRLLWSEIKDEDMTADFLFNISATAYEVEKKLLAKNQPDKARIQRMRADDMKRFAEIFPALKERMTMCENLCRQPDCYTEHVIPMEMGIESQGGNLKSVENMPPFKFMLGIHPPKESVVVVKTQAKLLLLDFIVYVLSCLSFWFGFCPLTAAKKHEILFGQGRFRTIVQKRLFMMIRAAKLDKEREERI